MDVSTLSILLSAFYWEQILAFLFDAFRSLLKTNENDSKNEGCGF